MKRYKCTVIERTHGIPNEDFDVTLEENVITKTESNDFAQLLCFIKEHIEDKWFVRGNHLVKDDGISFFSEGEEQNDIYRSNISYEFRIEMKPNQLLEHILKELFI